MEGFTNKNSNTAFYKVAAGALRINCEETDPKAEIRFVKKPDGTEIRLVERVHNQVQAIFVGASLYEGDTFKSWNIIMQHGDGSRFKLTVSENSHYGTDFLKKLPNMIIGEIYTIRPYDYNHKTKKNKKGEPKRVIGLDIKLEDAERGIGSFYHDFKQLKDKSWKITCKHGYPDPSGEKDSDDWKVYFLQETKFLRTAAIKWIEKNPELPVPPKETAPVSEPEDAPDDERPTNNDDFPF